MAITIKKTSVPGRTPNTFVLSADGDIGTNTRDGKMWLSNGSVVFELGANLSGNSTIGGTLTVGNSTVNTFITGSNLTTTDILAETLEIMDTAYINTYSMTIGVTPLTTVITDDTMDLGGRLTFDVDTQYVDPPSGSLTWNVTEDCLDITQTDGSTLQTGLEQYIRVKNATGSTMTSGTLVMFTGVNGNNEPTAAPLIANSTFNPLYSIGVLTNPIANGAIGRATTFGKVRNIDTTGSAVSETWAEGDILWANPNYNGKLTKVKPTAPVPAISVAAVLKAHSTDGILLVRPLILPRLFYGSFTSNAVQNAASSNTATAITYTTEEFSSGHSIVTYNGVTNSAIQAQFSGLYNYQFSLQLQSSVSSKVRVWIWFRKNGVDIPNSASLISIESNGGYAIAAWNIIVSMAANDKFQIMWATDDHTKLNIPAEVATAFCPSIPSVILTVTEVSQ